MTDETTAPRRRLRVCVERWPDAETGSYNPRCCRFPKSCSADIYLDSFTPDDELEPLSAPAAPLENEATGLCIGGDYCGRTTNGYFETGSHGPGWYCGWCEAIPGVG